MLIKTQEMSRVFAPNMCWAPTCPGDNLEVISFNIHNNLGDRYY